MTTPTPLWKRPESKCWQSSGAELGRGTRRRTLHELPDHTRRNPDNQGHGNGLQFEKNRHFLTLRDFSPQEISFLLKLAADLKAAKLCRHRSAAVGGLEITLIFRPRDSTHPHGFEVVALIRRQGYLSQADRHPYWKSARNRSRTPRPVLGRVYDAIRIQGFGQAVVEELAEHAGVPVYNGLI